nr:hypothetical protein [Herbidospora daliensis]
MNAPRLRQVVNEVKPSSTFSPLVGLAHLGHGPAALVENPHPQLITLDP